ncbi:MAG: class I SAM-dependent methyltransferase [Euryarchaeota archaeon]|nr:class I SAM-dependent methyltransferase [Euryarchaeota archaeon]
MKIQRTLSESAFLVNESRARRVDISQDRYAQLWVSKATRELWDNFTAKVYPYDAVELGLRNRFFLDTLRLFVRSAKNPVFVNMGAGFTSYPFLVEEPCHYIEVDLEYVIDFKRKQIETWIKNGRMPKRTIDFIPADLCSAGDRKRLQTRFISALADAPSFILLEGITYYLDEAVLHALFEMCAVIQRPGSVLAFDYWDPMIAENPVFLRFKKFCAERFGHKETHYTLFNEEFIHEIQGYTPVEQTDIQKLEQRYTDSDLLKNSFEILPENYVVLQRK